MTKKTSRRGTKTRHPGLYDKGGGSWTLCPTVKCQKTGKMLSAQKTIGPGITEGQALDALMQLRDELHGVADPSPPVARVTLRDYALRWLEVRAQWVRHGVADRYARCLAQHVLPVLGDIYLDRLDRDDVGRWVLYAERATKPNGEPYAASTPKGWWKVLRCLLKDAAAHYGLPDPTDRVKGPRLRSAPAREQRTLNGEQIRALLLAADEVCPKWSCAISVLATTGMRAGELCALHWGDIDLEARQITVQRSVWGKVEDAPKSGYARICGIHPEVVQRLRQHRQEQLRRQHPGLERGIVFPSRTGDYHFNSALKTPLAKAAAAAGIEQTVGPQVLRRSVNTLLALAGVDRLVVRDMLGHTQEEMTENYAGINHYHRLAAVDKILEM